jgi:predicted amidohydrolase YtcJ
MTTIFRNGRFFTAEGGVGATGDLFAPCMVVTDDLIEHVGHESDVAVLRAKEKGAPMVDMQNRIVVPGFIDGHMHLLLLGLALTKVNLEPCKNLDDIRATIKSYAETNPSAPRILCRGWMHPMTNGVALASMLDDLDDKPIFIDSKDLHSTWCNTPALEELGVESMANPAGGEIHRDENGRASGLLSETAALTLVMPHISRVATMQDKLDGIRQAIRAYSAAGFTGIIDMAMDENAWEALQLLKSQEKLPLRIAAHWLVNPSATEEASLAQVDRAIALHKQFNAETSPAFRIAGIKIVCDGVIDACTAALCEPYSSNGVSCDPLWSADMLSSVARRADSAGLQCALHAIGDGAIKLAIDALEKVCGPGRRHRVEHLELASSEDAKRLGKFGITASIQPVHADPAILRAWPKLLGEYRCNRAFAYKEFLDEGATLALGSDAPTAPYAPLPNLYTATTRRSAREPDSDATVNEHFALPLASALSAATAGAAYSCFSDGWAGCLKPGLKADFAVLDMEWEPKTLLKARVSQTWYEGQKVFDHEQR